MAPVQLVVPYGSSREISPMYDKVLSWAVGTTLLLAVIAIVYYIQSQPAPVQIFINK